MRSPSPWPAALVASTLLLGVALAAGCSDRRVDDSELGSLVYAEKEQAIEIDVDGAATRVPDMVMALAVPHSQIGDRLGPHTVKGRSSAVVSREDVVISELSDATTLVLGDDGVFRAEADNNHEYGRHAIFVGGVLYLRPRFGKYHRRAPASRDEPRQIRDEMFSTVSATFDLLHTRAELSDRGKVTVGGRPARRVDISTAPAAKDRPPEALAQKRWRETIVVEKVSGQVSLDIETGAPLAATIEGSIRFTRDGKTFTMRVEASHALTDIGVTPTIEAPAAEDTVSAPTVRDEVDEQRKLLEGLAPAGGPTAAPAPKEAP